jgi:hypothetical protein
MSCWGQEIDWIKIFSMENIKYPEEKHMIGLRNGCEVARNF